MGWTNPRTYVFGELITVAIANEQWRDNELALWPYSANGDIAYRSSATALTALAIGTAGQSLKVNAGATAPEWGNSGMALIEEKVLGAPAASFDFTSIPATYRNLKLIVNSRSVTAANTDSIVARCNNDSGNNYDYQRVFAAGASISPSDSFGSNNLFLGLTSGANAGAGLSGCVESLFIDYKGAIFNKTVLSQSSLKYGTSTNNLSISHTSCFWRSSSAINRLTIFSAGNLDTGSVASLYGLI